MRRGSVHYTAPIIILEIIEGATLLPNLLEVRSWEMGKGAKLQHSLLSIATSTRTQHDGLEESFRYSKADLDVVVSFQASRDFPPSFCIISMQLICLFEDLDAQTCESQQLT